MSASVPSIEISGDDAIGAPEGQTAAGIRRPPAARGGLPLSVARRSDVPFFLPWSTDLKLGRRTRTRRRPFSIPSADLGHDGALEHRAMRDNRLGWLTRLLRPFQVRLQAVDQQRSCHRIAFLDDAHQGQGRSFQDGYSGFQCGEVCHGLN